VTPSTRARFGTYRHAHGSRALSFEYVRDPRHALEPESAGPALVRGAFHLLSLLAPYLEPRQRDHLMALSVPYRSAGSA